MCGHVHNRCIVGAEVQRRCMGAWVQRWCRGGAEVVLGDEEVLKRC